MISNANWFVCDLDGNKVENQPKFLKSPNFMQSWKDLIFQLDVNKSVFGNSYLFRNQGNLTKEVKSLFVLPSKSIKIDLTGRLYKQSEIKGVIKSIEDTDTNEKYDPDDVIIFRDYDGNPIVSDSKITTLKTQLSNIKHAYDSRNILIRERGANKIISLQSSDNNGVIPMSPKEKKAAEEKLTKEYGIGENQRRTQVTSVPISVHDMSFPTKDLMLFEEIEDDFNAVVDMYGISRDLFSKQKGSTFENQRIAIRATYQNTIIPQSEAYAESLSNSLGLTENNMMLKADFSHLTELQENEKEKAEAKKIKTDSVIAMLDRGLIDENRAKEILGE